MDTPTQLKDILSDEEWLLTEHKYNPETLPVYETLFTLANGYVGVRGTLVWNTRHGWPCTFFAGVYDRALEVKSELANAPEWIGLKLTIGDELVDFEKGKLLHYNRTLDMHRGLLYEAFKWQSPKGKIVAVETLRLVHQTAKHRGLIYGRLVSENYAGKVVLEGGLNGYMFNTGYSEQLKNKHFKLIDHTPIGDSVYLEMRTYGTQITVGEASQLMVNTGFERDVRYEKDYIANALVFEVEPNKQYEFCKYVSFYTSRDLTNVKVATLNELNLMLADGYKKLIATHTSAWATRWRTADVEIEGDPVAQKSVRFSLFHLMQCVNPYDERVSIPAKGLHGEGYKGHIFWDTEMYMLPFFIYTDPKAARALLMYRYNMLEGARQNAQLNGYRGAQFPWESTDDGSETIPREVGDPFVKTYRVCEGEEEHHVVAAIAYGVDHYYRATHDHEFMSNYGLEILLETARFWASRVEFDPTRNKYVIKKLIGPDEIHYHVDNNVYTNFIAKWNLETAASYAEKFNDSEIIKKLGITPAEIAEWRQIAANILILRDKRTGIYEQFEGYFNLIDVQIEPSDTGIPRIPDEWRDWDKLQRTKLIKQPDVVMLLYVFRDKFSLHEKKVNFNFYDPRTLYRSSLAASVSSIIANEIGYEELAYRYFMMSARVGLDNIYRNTQHGFHAAAGGGTWQAVVNGFAGMHIHADKLQFNPRLPKHWRKLRFTIMWRGHPIFVELTHDTFTVCGEPSYPAEGLEIIVNGRPVKITPEKQAIPIMTCPSAKRCPDHNAECRMQNAN